jgi:hypothetical protein
VGVPTFVVQNTFPSSCNWYGVMVAIALVNMLQLVETAGSVHLLYGLHLVVF